MYLSSIWCADQDSRGLGLKHICSPHHKPPLPKKHTISIIEIVFRNMQFFRVFRPFVVSKRI